MNHWHMEVMAELDRQNIQCEMKQIRLEEQALKARVYRPGWFAKTMFKLGNWMISTGKQLRRRYEVPVVGCRHEPTGSYAR